MLSPASYYHSSHSSHERIDHRHVDWSHAWEVRGHWRKVNGVGKDREGSYTVTGFTWVKPHTKGKGEVVKKQRVVVELQ